jgi:hypothetical protein
VFLPLLMCTFGLRFYVMEEGIRCFWPGGGKRDAAYLLDCQH